MTCQHNGPLLELFIMIITVYYDYYIIFWDIGGILVEYCFVCDTAVVTSNQSINVSEWESEWVALQFSDLTLIKFNMRPKLTRLNFLIAQALLWKIHQCMLFQRKEGKKEG